MINYILNYHIHTEKSRRTGILGNFLFHMCIKSFRINTLKLFQNDVIQRKIIYGLSILIYQFLFHSLAFKREKYSVSVRQFALSYFFYATLFFP